MLPRLLPWYIIEKLCRNLRLSFRRVEWWKTRYEFYILVYIAWCGKKEKNSDQMTLPIFINYARDAWLYLYTYYTKKLTATRYAGDVKHMQLHRRNTLCSNPRRRGLFSKSESKRESRSCYAARDIDTLCMGYIYICESRVYLLSDLADRQAGGSWGSLSSSIFFCRGKFVHTSWKTNWSQIRIANNITINFHLKNCG